MHPTETARKAVRAVLPRRWTPTNEVASLAKRHSGDLDIPLGTVRSALSELERAGKAESRWLESPRDGVGRPKQWRRR